MKWLPSKKSLKYAPYKHKNLDSTSQATRLIICSLITGMFLCGDADRLKLDSALAEPQEIAQRANYTASKIGVKILAKDFLGSGFLLGRRGSKYFVITNRHVIRGGEAPYKIETSDNRVYTAEVAIGITNVPYDLAVLTFEADVVYATATIGNSQFLKVGEPVFAAGFPHEVAAKRSPRDSEKLTLKLGRVTTVLDRALTEGYQIGYTNNVQKGMSGGPVLNSRGEVVGINGKHAYPLWESPEVYQDGTQPCPALQELIARSSLAIPIEKSFKLMPQLESLQSATASDYKFDRQGNDPLLVARMQAEARHTVQSCQNSSEEL